MSYRAHRFWMIALAFLTAQASACGYSPFEQPGSLEISGEPEGAKVVVTGPNGFRDERGLPWISGGVPSGTYHVTVSRTGYVSQEKDLSVSPGVTARWTEVKLKHVEDVRRRQQRQARASGDAVTIGGRMWQKRPAPNKMNWNEAKGYCSNLSLGGYSDWRLPSISELRSIIRGCAKTQTGGACKVTDSCRSWDSCRNSECSGCSGNRGPANGCYWPNELMGKCSWFWSSSSRSDYNNLVWFVDFHLGDVDNLHKYGDLYARCVRGRP